VTERTPAKGRPRAKAADCHGKTGGHSRDHITQIEQHGSQPPTTRWAGCSAILDGTDAVISPNETAVTEHPVEAVAMMARIATQFEQERR